MANQLIQIVAFTAVAPTAIAALPHTINANGVAYIPDEVAVDNSEFQVISCTATTLTVQNNGVGAGNCNVLLKLWQSNTRALGANTAPGNFNGGLTPRPFITSSTTIPIAVILGPTFVFRPGGVALGNVFTSWSALNTAMALFAGPKILFFDDSIAPCVVPTGLWDQTLTSWNGWFPGAVVTVQEGADLPGLRQLSDTLYLTFSGTTPPVSDFVNGDTFVLLIGARMTTSGAGPFLQMNVAGNIVVGLYGGGAIDTGTTPVIRADAVGSSITLAGVTGFATVGSDTLSSDPGAFVVLALAASGANLSEDQPSATVVFANFTQARLSTTGVLTSNTDFGGSSNFAEFDPTLGPLTSRLPAAFNNRGTQMVYKKTVGGVTNTITITTLGADTIDGAATAVIAAATAFGSLTFISDGISNWSIIGAYP